MEIDDERNGHDSSVWFTVGFRPFFVAAGWLAVLGMALWYAFYQFALPWQVGLAPLTWHAHEMIFGYSTAVVAGFLLTAIKIWTGRPTLHGRALVLLLAVWLIARLALLLPWPGALLAAALADLVFLTSLSAALSVPVIRARQWAQVGILSKVVLLLAANGLFYAGVYGAVEQGIRWGLYSGLYLLLSLIFVVARKVLPVFIEEAVAGDAGLRNRRWLDLASLVGFLLWAVLDVFTNQPGAVAGLSLGLAALHTLRLVDWHHRAIWRQPLLWPLYVAYACFVPGFVLKAAVVGLGLSPYLALHAFAVGGLGLMTMGMMARITVVQTGRNVAESPGLAVYAFFALTIAALFRVAMPLLDTAHYMMWVGIAQAAWVAGFALLLAMIQPLCARPALCRPESIA